MSSETETLFIKIIITVKNRFLGRFVMKVLICGGNGQLGWDCQRVFGKENEVAAYDLPDRAGAGNG